MKNHKGMKNGIKIQTFVTDKKKPQQWYTMQGFYLLLSHTSAALLLASVSYCRRAALWFVSWWPSLSHCMGSQASSFSLCWCCFLEHRNSFFPDCNPQRNNVSSSRNQLQNRRALLSYLLYSQ